MSNKKIVNIIKKAVKGAPLLFKTFEQYYKRKEIASNSSLAYKVRMDQGLDSERVDLGKRSELCITAIARGEEPYFVEWIEFHRLMGVDHFFIYDNSFDQENSPAIALLTPYIEEGILTLIPWPHIEGLRDWSKRKNMLSIQNLAYGDFILRYKHNCRWVMVIDIDEFAYPSAKSGFKTIREYTDTLDPRRIMGSEMSMYVFGSGGLKSRPEGLVIESYTKRKEECHGYKSIGNSAYIKDIPYSGAHRFFYKIAPGKRVFVPDPVLRLNHYWVKSLEEWNRKGVINSVGSMAGKETEERFYQFDGESNGYEDEGEILRYLDELKERIAAFEV